MLMKFTTARQSPRRCCRRRQENRPKRSFVVIAAQSIVRHRTNDLPFCGGFISQVIYSDSHSKF